MDNYSEILLKNKSLELVRFVLIEGEESQLAGCPGGLEIMIATPNVRRQVDKADNFNSGVEKRDATREPKLTNRICSREVCNHRVSEANRMLCPSCYQRGNHLGETEVSFSDTERAHWEWMQYALLRRIEEQVKVYSFQNMKQEELRSLVPSLQEEAA